MKYNADDRAQRTIASFVEILGQKPYTIHTARELLWGYENQLLGLIKTVRDSGVFPDDKSYPYDKFGLFVGVIIERICLIFSGIINYNS